MNFSSKVLLVWLQLVLVSSAAFAQSNAPTTAPSFGEVFGRMVPMFVIVFFIFYFMVMKPQQAKLKAQQSLLSSLKRGEQVVTSGGIIGKVAGVEKGYVMLEVASNTRIRVEASHISRRYEEVTEVVAADKAKAS